MNHSFQTCDWWLSCKHNWFLLIKLMARKLTCQSHLWDICVKRRWGGRPPPSQGRLPRKGSRGRQGMEPWAKGAVSGTSRHVVKNRTTTTTVKRVIKTEGESEGGRNERRQVSMSAVRWRRVQGDAGEPGFNLSHTQKPWRGRCVCMRDLFLLLMYDRECVCALASGCLCWFDNLDVIKLHIWFP